MLQSRKQAIGKTSRKDHGMADNEVRQVRTFGQKSQNSLHSPRLAVEVRISVPSAQVHVFGPRGYLPMPFKQLNIRPGLRIDSRTFTMSELDSRRKESPSFSKAF